MAFTQFAETGNIIPALGVKSAIRNVTGMPAMMREIREMVATGAKPNQVLRDFDMMGGGVGLDDYHSSRMFDVKDNSVELYNGSDMGLITRSLRAGAHANMVMSGQRLMLAAQTRGVAEEILRKSFQMIREGGTHHQKVAFDDMGIDAELREALAADMDRVATFDDKGRLTAINLRNSKALTPNLTNRLQQSIERGAAQMIQKNYTGETGKWMHNSLLKLMFQFRTFPLVAVEKQFGRNLRNYGGVKTVSLILASMSVAAPIYMARVALKAAAMEDKKAEEYLDRNLAPAAILRATLNYASAAGFAGDILDLGSSGISTIVGDDLSEQLGLDTAAGRYGGNAGTVQGLIPAVGAANDVMSGDLMKTFKLLPGANNPLALPLIEALDRLGDD